MESFVGTSGWSYSWNEKRTFDWYAEESGLNAVELNASFYRFPLPNMVKSWARKGRDLGWSIKVNRLLTHILKFAETAQQTWKKFSDLFMPLDSNIDFYLFQIPPFMSPKSAPAIEDFVEEIGLKERFALEVRNIEWYNRKWIDWASKLGITWVSVDSPEFPLDVFNTNGLVYERMHGRTGWYSHYYTDEELMGVKERILEANPKNAYVFFNNNTNMLRNGRQMLKLLTQGCASSSFVK